MFDISTYIDLDGFKKIGYRESEINIGFDKLSHILEMDSDLVKKIIDSGEIPRNLPRPEYNNTFEKIYLLFILLNYILKIAGYDLTEIRKLWTDASIYDSAYVKPPWYKNGLNSFLINEKCKGLSEAVKWIAEY